MNNMPHTSKEEEIKQEYVKIATTGGFDSQEAIADYWLNIRQQALTEQKMKFREMVEKVLKPLEGKKYLLEIEDTDTAWEHLGLLEKIKSNLLSELTNL